MSHNRPPVRDEEVVSLDTSVAPEEATTEEAKKDSAAEVTTSLAATRLDEVYPENLDGLDDEAPVPTKVETPETASTQPVATADEKEEVAKEADAAPTAEVTPAPEAKEKEEAELPAAAPLSTVSYGDSPDVLFSTRKIPVSVPAATQEAVAVSRPASPR